MKKFLIIALSVLSVIYLINPTAGVFEILPDNLPVVGNIDETLAAYLLFSSIQFFRGKEIGLFKSGK